MDLGYPLMEWPILAIIGMFIFLIVGLAYGSAITANLPDPAGDETNQTDSTH